jgi:hypothetical protein
VTDHALHLQLHLNAHHLLSGQRGEAVFGIALIVLVLLWLISGKK